MVLGFFVRLRGRLVRLRGVIVGCLGMQKTGLMVTLVVVLGRRPV